MKDVHHRACLSSVTVVAYFLLALKLIQSKFSLECLSLFRWISLCRQYKMHVMAGAEVAEPVAKLILISGCLLNEWLFWRTRHKLNRLITEDRSNILFCVNGYV